LFVWGGSGRNAQNNGPSREAFGVHATKGIATSVTAGIARKPGQERIAFPYRYNWKFLLLVSRLNAFFSSLPQKPGRVWFSIDREQDHEARNDVRLKAAGLPKAVTSLIPAGLFAARSDKIP
jgi:hypothetical protein